MTHVAGSVAAVAAVKISGCPPSASLSSLFVSWLPPAQAPRIRRDITVGGGGRALKWLTGLEKDVCSTKNADGLHFFFFFMRYDFLLLFPVLVLFLCNNRSDGALPLCSSRRTSPLPPSLPHSLTLHPRLHSIHPWGPIDSLQRPFNEISPPLLEKRSAAQSNANSLPPFLLMAPSLPVYIYSLSLGELGGGAVGCRGKAARGQGRVLLTDQGRRMGGNYHAPLWYTSERCKRDEPTAGGGAVRAVGGGIEEISNSCQM